MHMLQTHSAQAPAALLASQPCTLPARSGDPEQVDDVVANCLQCPSVGAGMLTGPDHHERCLLHAWHRKARHTIHALTLV